jgi:hypothetical protein
MARLPLMPQTTIPAAGTYTTTPIALKANAGIVLIHAKFAYGSGGTTVKAYVQTSVDNGVNWMDIACFAFALAAATKVSKVNAATALTAATVPTDGALADDTVKDGIVGDRIRVKYVVAGTYAGASHLTIAASTH